MDEEEGECRLGNRKTTRKKERKDMDEFLQMATEKNELRTKWTRSNSGSEGRVDEGGRGEKAW